MEKTLDDLVDTEKALRREGLKKGLKVVASIGVAAGIFGALFYSYLNSGYVEKGSIPPQAYPLIGFGAGMFGMTVLGMYKYVLNSLNKE